MHIFRLDALGLVCHPADASGRLLSFITERIPIGINVVVGAPRRCAPPA